MGGFLHKTTTKASVPTTEAFSLPQSIVRSLWDIGGEYGIEANRAVQLSNVQRPVQIVRAEADSRSFIGTIECYYCGGPLTGREGDFVLKHFVADKPRTQAKPLRVK